MSGFSASYSNRIKAVEASITDTKNKAQMTKITSDTGAPKLVLTNMTKDFLSEVLTLGIGKHTFYVTGGVINAPSGTGFRGECTITEPGFGVLFGIDENGVGWTNHMEYGMWKQWTPVNTTGASPVWYTIPLLNGVIPYGAGTPLQYCKIGHIAFIRGALTNILSPGIYGGILPAEVLPAGQSHSTTQNTSTIAGGKTRTARWQINTSGQIILDGNSDAVYSQGDWYPIHTSYIC